MDETRVVSDELKAKYRQMFVERTHENYFFDLATYHVDDGPWLSGVEAVWAGYEWAINFKPEDI